MGCGASSAVQTQPNDKPNDIIHHNDNSNTLVKASSNFISSNTNGFHPKSRFSFFTHNKIGITEFAAIVASIGIQTEGDINGIKSQYSQTDGQLLPEDELEMMMIQAEQLVQCDDFGSKLRIGECETDLSDVNNKSVLLQTEEPNYFRSKNKSNLKFKNASLVTVDVGVQVKRSKVSCTTQTRLGSINYYNPKGVPNKLILHHSRDSLNKNDNSLVSNDIDNHQLWTIQSQKNHENLINDLKEMIITKTNLQDFESQTDPLFSNVLAANSAGNDLTILQEFNDISSPFAHIEKELLNHHDASAKIRGINDAKLQDCLSKLLDDIDDNFNNSKRKVLKADATVQTDNDPITDEAPEYAARPPPCRKREMIPSLNMFREIDRRTNEVPESLLSSPQDLVAYLCKRCTSDLLKVRAIFKWITNYMKYDWKYMGVTMTTAEILKCGEGVCKDYCQLFGDLCQYAGLRVKKIDGFAKGHDYRPGHQFKPGEDITHTWNAVYILSSWRLIDTTWGTGFTDHTGKFQRKCNEHFFLTDPEVLIWTHFPYNEVESDYCRWQLLDKPITLEEFNALPKVSPNFFDFNLKIRIKPQNPIVFRISTEIKIGAHEPMRYKYKLYPSDEVENSSLNHYLFCQLKEERSVGSFMVTPPIEGRYFLKIFAKPEREMQEGTDSTSLQNVITFLLECTRARRYIEPYPLNELPWGPTQTFYDYKLRLNQMGPVIVTWGGKRRLIIEGNETMLITYQVFDADGMEMDTRNIIIRDDSGTKSTFTINPPRVGTFKFMVFGMPKPKQKGKWRLPLLATFLIDCKLIKLPQYDEDFIASQSIPPEEPRSSEKKKR